MNGAAVIQTGLHSTAHLVRWFTEGFSDAELFVRPVPGANHLAWQLGHLIHAERAMITTELPDAVYPAMPAGFGEAHNAAAATQDGPAGFLTLAEYLSLFDAVRAATVAAVEKLSESDLDRPTVGMMRSVAPTLGALLVLICNHTMMHAGQFSVVRRLLGKPVLF